MVSPQHIWDKIEIIEERLMAYKEMLDSGVLPDHIDILIFKQHRLGKEVSVLERSKAVQASIDIHADIERNLTKIEVSYKQYLDKRRQEKRTALLAHFQEIERWKNPEKKAKKERKKDAET